ncbi:PAS domain-containing hybrid sensor histidine kinase/response regulator [Desulfogranum japonicum]|uniref:PAS domain-containing hybrid sensor histidine kinase/response regulator n=1 Tax=Desulfogranum japonicum TaxID=231447 RepID=UPI000404C366|nr:PAS domain S-box protein [Desulfogranum japonicum]
MQRHFLPFVTIPVLATLALAGLFYLPYNSVRNKTIDNFHGQQTLLLNKAVEGIQKYFATYHTALEYLADQETIVQMDESGKLLLEDFYAIHQSQIFQVSRTDSRGRVMFAVPGYYRAGEGVITQEQLDAVLPQKILHISEEFSLDDGTSVVLFTHPVYRDESFEGNVSFLVPCEVIGRMQVGNLGIEQSALPILFSKNGKTLYARKSDLTGKMITEYSSRELQTIRADMQHHGQGFFQLEDGFFDQENTGKRKRQFGMYIPVDLPGGAYWSLLMVSPENEVLSTMVSFRKQWLMVTGITLLAVGFMGLGLSWIVLKRQQEKKQREMQGQLVQLLEHAPMGVLLVNEKNIISYANRSALGLTESASLKAITGESLLRFFHEEDLKKISGEINGLLPDREEKLISIKLMTCKQQERDVMINVTPFMLGAQKNCIVTIQDITEERKVVEVQRRLATAVEQVKELVMITDTNGTIEYVNATFCDITGYSVEESIGKSSQILWDDANDPKLYAQLKRELIQGTVWQGRIMNRRKDGSVFVSASSVSPVRNMAGVITHYVTVERDITHEVEFESRMQHSQKMEAVGTLAGGIAHDFNNILGAIIGFTDIAMLQNKDNPELHDNLKQIRQAGKRAADLVQQILTFSRETKTEKQAVLVAPVIEESLSLLRASLPTTIEIRQQIIDPDSMVFADPVQVQQIVVNLFTNAFHSMREKGGVLTLKLEKRPTEECEKILSISNGECVALTIQDTGTGMKDETLQRIFTPFFTTKQPGEGTGMGLSVVQGIVDELNGHILVDSVLGEGTTFIIYLPAIQGIQEGKILSSEEPLPTGNEHILVVDDEKEIRKTAGMMLQHLGYTVSTSGDPREVLGMFDDGEENIDLVITDHTMPKMTGVELTRQLHTTHPKVPVILCTGYSDKLNHEVAREAGAHCLMMKPIDLHEMAVAVRSALDHA